MRRVSWSFLAVLAACVLLSGCRDRARLSAEAFKQEYALAGQRGATRIVEYLGVDDGRAFLCITSLGVERRRWEERIVYAELRDFDDAFRQTLIESHPPPRPRSVFD